MFGEKDEKQVDRTFNCPDCDGEWQEYELEEGDSTSPDSVGFCPECGHEFINDEEHEDEIKEE